MPPRPRGRHVRAHRRAVAHQQRDVAHHSGTRCLSRNRQRAQDQSQAQPGGNSGTEPQRKPPERVCLEIRRSDCDSCLCVRFPTTAAIPPRQEEDTSGVGRTGIETFPTRQVFGTVGRVVSGRRSAYRATRVRLAGMADGPQRGKRRARPVEKLDVRRPDVVEQACQLNQPGTKRLLDDRQRR